MMAFIFRRIAGACLLVSAPMLWGCVTVAEFRKLEHQIAVLQGARGPGGHETQQVADMTLEIEELRAVVAQLEGRVDLAQHQAQEALSEARSARQAASGAALGTGATPGPGDGAATGDDPLEGVSAGLY
jgi:outer membrane murein-binding lipoprotein Lpp